MSGAFEIERVPGDYPPDALEARFVAPERPFILEGVTDGWAAVERWTPEYLRAGVTASGQGAAQDLYWFNLDEGAFAGDFRAPELVRRLAERDPARRRARWLRLWLASAGTRTRWHYDGNSLHVFNAQVRGRKRFTLVSPETPLPSFAFSSAARASYRPPREVLGARHVHATFDLAAGELLFLPRYWQHHVESLDGVNVNLNWVLSETGARERESTAARRERECVALLYVLARALSWTPLRGLDLVGYTRDYAAGRDFEVPRRFFRETPALRLAARWLAETAQVVPDLVRAWWAAREEVALNGQVRRGALDFFSKRDRAPGAARAR